MKNAIFFLACVLIGGLGAYYAEPYVHENPDAILIIVTVFTVFAGFLVAIITVLGDPASMPDGWKAKELRRNSTENRIIRHNALFFLYLITIGLLFVGSVLNKVPAHKIDGAWKVWTGRCYLFLAITSFLLTFALPFSLKKMQMGRLDSEIDRLRADKGLKAPDDGV